MRSCELSEGYTLGTIVAIGHWRIVMDSAHAGRPRLGLPHQIDALLPCNCKLQRCYRVAPSSSLELHPPRERLTAARGVADVDVKGRGRKTGGLWLRACPQRLLAPISGQPRGSGPLASNIHKGSVASAGKAYWSAPSGGSAAAAADSSNRRPSERNRPEWSTTKLGIPSCHHLLLRASSRSVRSMICFRARSNFNPGTLAEPFLTLRKRQRRRGR